MFVTGHLGNGPADLLMSTHVWLSAMRWPIETCLEDSKQEIGLGDYQVRSWIGWHHHMTLCILAHFFLVRLKLKLGAIAPEKLTGVRPGWTPQPPRRMHRPNWLANDDFERALDDIRRQMEQLERMWRDQLLASPGEMLAPPRPAEPHAFSAPPRGERRGTAREEIDSTVVLSETRDGLTVTLTDHNGDRTVKALEKGHVLFEGPVNNDQQLRAVPEKIRPRVEELRHELKVETPRPAAAPAPGIPL